MELEARLGELFNQMPKQSGARTDLKPLPTAGKKLDDDSDSDDEEPPQRPKLEVAKELGFNKNQVSQFQKLADNPDAVQAAMTKAREAGVYKLVMRSKLPNAEKFSESNTG